MKFVSFALVLAGLGPWPAAGFRKQHRKRQRMPQGSLERPPQGHGQSSEQNTQFRAKMAAVNQESPNFPGAHANVQVGVAFSGGGVRAMGWAMGVLRALEDLGLMANVDAVSSVSGGTWAAAPYIFADNTATELLGRSTSPGQLTLDLLHAQDGLLTHSVNSNVNLLTVWYGLLYPTHEVWDRVVADTYLAPFNLGDRSLYMAGSQEHVAEICAANPQLSPEQFVVPRPGRPKVFIMNGIMAAPPGYTTERDKVVAIQMSPDYTGSPFWPDYDGSIKRINYTNWCGSLCQWSDIARGGGFVESFAFGGQAPTDGQSGSRVVSVAPPSKPFTLSAAMAISSQMQFWSRREVWPVLPEGEPSQPAVEHELADGGILENAGVLPLVQRGARKVVTVLGTAVPLDPAVDFCAERTEAEWARVIEPCDKVACSLTCLFGYTFADGTYDYSHNQVFERSEMPALLCRLQQLKQAGKPTVAMSTLRVRRNTWWGIEGGYDMQLAVVYNDKCDEFESNLATETRDALRRDSVFGGHPFYGTAFYLRHPIMSIMAAQSEYYVRENADMFRALLA